jgi:hypothetical protein
VVRRISVDPWRKTNKRKLLQLGRSPSLKMTEEEDVMTWKKVVEIRVATRLSRC